MIKVIDNKWTRAAIPALLIHCSIGTVYCWSTFKEAIAEQIEMSTFSVGWAFSLAIFFLGISAAFAGEIVEIDIQKSSLISCWCFFIGMMGTGMSIFLFKGISALIGVYVFYGCIMGIGLGIGYITPVKNLMLWFSDQKGLATGISIMGFGLAKAIATPIMEWMQAYTGLTMMFIYLSIVYWIVMFIAHLLIKKPNNWSEKDKTDNNFILKDIVTNKSFILIWLMFYLNIHCGLMIITYEKQILNTLSTSIIIVSVIPSVTALCNALGRIGYATLSDKLKDRLSVYQVIFWLSLSTIGIYLLITIFASNDVIAIMIWCIIVLITINLGYGGGFSTLPALLSQKFGMDNISKIHGLMLTAWAIAGVTGNNLSELILKNTKMNYNYLFFTIELLYILAFLCCLIELKRGYKNGNT